MATKTQNPTTLSRFGRFGIGRGVKSQSASPRPHSRGHSNPDRENSDEWYIPYNGPYEAPKQPRRMKERDSWGDLVNGEEEDDDAVLDDRDLHHRYGGRHLRNTSYGSWDVGNEREGRTRNRTMSAVSHQTVSSGTIDPSRQNVGLTRHRSSQSSGGHQPTPSYISLDAAGGVGESPVPQRRAYSSQGGSNVNRGSIASFFTFGQSKKAPPSPPKTNSNIPLSKTVAHTTAPDRSDPPARHKPENTLTLEISKPRTTRTDDEDYYNSYYATLVTTPKQISDDPHASTSRNLIPSERKQLTNEQHSITPPSPSISSSTAPQIRHPHPYAYVFPSAALSPTPQSAPPVSGGNGQTNHDEFMVTVTEPPRFATNARGIHFPPAEQPSTYPRGALKASISTPNLRNSSDGQPLPVLRAPLPSGKDRWLSAETWCDAILFPRPRFRIKPDGDQLGWNGRIVSPPPSPILRRYDDGAQPLSYKGEIGIQSRVLAHSRSVVELVSSAAEAGPSESSRLQPQKTATSAIEGDSTVRRGRPKSFAQDDLALPSPIPSLTKVLEEGKLLDSQRQKWQAQATQSFQNKRTRSLSRARSKSLTHSRPRRKGSDAGRQGDASYFSARVFLGSQAVMPVLSSSNGTRSNGTRSTTFSSSSHSHSNSLSKTISKSSKASHSRGHSRNESWGKSAIKMAKSTAALCGLNGEPLDLPQGDGRGSALEDALRADGTKIIRLADPAQTPIDITGISSTDDKNAIGVSPVPSGSYDDVGLALSTPPPTDSGHSYEPISLPDHPYAQSAYPQHRDAPAVPEHIHSSMRGSDYAGPHPSTSKLMPIAPHVNLNDVSTRHRLPPHAMLHPYAQAGVRDSYLSDEKVIPRVRLDSEIPPPAKMWAQGPSGEIEEILPSEIVYSPFSPPSNYPSRSYGQSPGTSDTVGIGEALAYSMRHGDRESGFGGSADRETGSSNQPDKDASVKEKDAIIAEPHVHRKTVQYDFLLLSSRQEPAQSLDPVFNRTQTSSPEPMVVPSPEAGYTSASSPYDASSTSSRQMSPRPLLDGVDDLDHFRDLFYRPSLSRSPSRQTATHRDPNLPWDVRPHSDRTASGLTSLARQLSEELEELHALNEPSSDPDTTSKALDDLAASDFHFIFSDAQQVVLPQGTTPLQLPKKRSGLQLSMNIPEDVGSSRASSPLQRSPLDDDNTIQMYRVGHVDAVSTPLTMSNDHRLSGHLSLVDEPELNAEREVQNHKEQTNINTLLPPSAGLTRSSYMTTSTNGSRMSGLSDFPSPPEQVEMTPAHMSVLNSYFDDNDVLSSQLKDPSGRPPSGSRTVSRRMTFGGDEDIEDIANALSAHP